MRYHSQNLNEDRLGNVKGSIFWHGRAWLYTKHEIHWEWLLGRHANGFSIYAAFGGGDNDSGLMLHVCIPFVLSVYLGIAGIVKCKECKTGVAIHNGGFWIYPLSYVMESNSKDPWWRKCHSWYFPWCYDWYSTEVLEHGAHLPGFLKTIWKEMRGDRRKGDVFASMDERNKAALSVSETYDYTYTRKNGEVQNRKATVHVNRMTWRMKWWPLLPFKKVSTSIDVKFDDEVGEGTGTWKGGCLGCGYELRHAETPLECLRRMESERKFGR